MSNHEVIIEPHCRENGCEADVYRIRFARLEDKIARLTVDNLRLRRIVETVCRSAKQIAISEVRTGPVWSVVSYVCGLGSRSAIELCREFGVDPNEMVDRPGDGEEREDGKT